MADDLLGKLSGSSNPYKTGVYSPESNEKNTLTMESYFKLLAAQLANQDMTNPMDNSEMMAQMTQMAMVQSVSAMTNSIQTSTAISTQTYAAGLVGQEVTVAITEENAYGQAVPVGVKYGRVESVDLTGSTPILKLMGEDKKYPLSYVLGMGKIDNPYKDDEDKEDGENGDKVDGGESEGTDPALSDPQKQMANPLLDKGLLT